MKYNFLSIIEDISGNFSIKKKNSCKIRRLLPIHNDLSKKMHTLSPREKNILKKYLNYIDSRIESEISKIGCKNIGTCENCTIPLADWEIKLLHNTNITVVKSTGFLDLGMLKNMCRDIHDFMLSHDSRLVLGDHRDMNPDISFLNVYYLPYYLRSIKFGRDILTSIVYNEKHENHFLIYQNVCNSLNLKTRCFSSMEVAIEYLQEYGNLQIS